MSQNLYQLNNSSEIEFNMLQKPEDTLKFSETNLTNLINN